MLIYDQLTEGIVARRIRHSPDVNTYYGPTFYNESSCPLVSDSVIIGNTNSSEPYSLTNSGLVLGYDRGELLKNITFYNFPDNNTQAIRGSSLPGW